MCTPSHTTQLLIRLKDGDRTVLGELMGRHLEWLHQHVRSHLGGDLRQRLDSSDIVQAALVSFLEHGPRFIPASGAQFRSLMKRIVVNAIRDRDDWFCARRRDMNRERSITSDSCVNLQVPHTDAPDEVAAGAELEARLRLALELLPLRHRQVLVMRSFEQRAFPEIGAALDLTEGAVRKTHDRARKLLSRAMARLRRREVDGLLEEMEAADRELSPE